MKSVSLKTQKKTVSVRLLEWYDSSRRELPWREAPGVKADPYRVWLSEIMLQQTTVKAVTPYFIKFLSLWPCVTDLAHADLNDILKAWAGLGYYSRARNLHACARKIVENFSGCFPEDEKQLLSLPGVGPYTAAAIMSIAFARRAVVMDGNVERVITRLFAVQEPLPSSKPQLKDLAGQLTPEKRPGDYAQAMMDLGATICTPQSPSCLICPLRALCKAHEQGLASSLPRKEPKSERPTRKCIAFVVVRDDGMVLVRQRPAKGLLGGMTEIPTTEWVVSQETRKQRSQLKSSIIQNEAPVEAEWMPVPGGVSHTFTHFYLEIDVYRASVSNEASVKLSARPEDCWWVAQPALGKEALPSVMKKIISHALSLK